MPPPPSPPPCDPYQVLGIARAATPAEITTAYRSLVRAVHPDTQHETADPARLVEILTAYDVLRDPHRRATYDRRHPVATPSPRVGSTSISVRVHPHRSSRQPDIRVGPVRRQDD